MYSVLCGGGVPCKAVILRKLLIREALSKAVAESTYMMIIGGYGQVEVGTECGR